MCKNIYLLIIILIYFFGCAAQGPASGGLADKKGPVLISIYPENETNNININQKIILTFDELLDPVSVPNSILSNENYKLKIKGRKIIIRSENSWPLNEVIKFYFSRKIRDYQKNFMASPIELVYSTGGNISDGSIQGNIIGFKKDKMIEVGLYRYPISDSSNYIQKVEIDDQGNFNFNFLDYGEYTLGAIESILYNFNEQISKKYYAMLSEKSININIENSNEYISMFLSEPIQKLKIVSVEMKTQYFCKLIMNDKSEENYTIDTSYFIGDTVTINLVKLNRLEKYNVPEYSFILPQVVDTIPPKYLNYNFLQDSLLITFSEPINIKPSSILLKKDSMNIAFNDNMLNSNTVLLWNINDTINQFELLGANIKDWNGNSMKDSTILVSNERSIINEVFIGGNILGTINYFGDEEIYIEAYDIINNEVYGTKVKNKQFKLKNLKSGLYKLWAFESLHENDSSIYYSGIWEPYSRAAKFTMYSDTIDVRARWDIEGVIIDFE